jgi:hypothetical protein
LTVTVVTEAKSVQVVSKPVVVQVFSNAAGGGGGSTQREEITIATENQTVFSLRSVPAFPEKTQLFVNGLKAIFNTEYAINSAVITWRSLYQLSPSDSMEIFY